MNDISGATSILGLRHYLFYTDRMTFLLLLYIAVENERKALNPSNAWQRKLWTFHTLSNYITIMVSSVLRLIKRFQFLNDIILYVYNIIILKIVVVINSTKLSQNPPLLCPWGVICCSQIEDETRVQSVDCRHILTV